MTARVSKVFTPTEVTHLWVPKLRVSVTAGRPQQIEDDTDELIDLNKQLVPHPRSTYAITVSGDSMETNISHGDTLLVDRALEPASGCIAIVEVDDELTVKRLSRVGGKLWLVPDNDNFKALEIKKDQRCKVWGVVTYVIRKV